ncbi:PREDICTED: protein DETOXIFICATION 44, chloroplastic isoform X1 [Theobroma cacao]|uniref:Protein DETOXIFICATION n=2 Tax=Theobroma cacao TaxID=3641 RepID=A0AB32V1J3_THECC|nr:PREDICTED: protein DETOXIFICATION 44, chloroplastic isoform X1 [Theobroma cacao]EOY07076.1 MATE efflux family protein 2 isoform 1 [Theobroma cacao]
MAATLSHFRSKFNAAKHPFLKPHKLSRNRSFSLCTPILPKSSKHKNSTTSLKTSPQQQNVQPEKSRSRLPSKPVGIADSDPTSSLLFRRLRDGFKIDELGLEILSIALPAALALAADPIASLVDTAFVGHLGSVELAAVGVSVSIFNLVSKLFNVPLLNITTSFVAEEQALIGKNSNDGEFEHQGKKVLPSVSTSLALAAGLGIAEAVALSVGSGFLLNIMGIPVDSPMRGPAEQFLSWRAFGAPPIVIALAAQGTFRGFKDTKTPLYAIGAGNLLNAILDAILIFPIGFGVGGAAVATVTSEYLIAIILLWELNGKVVLISPSVDWRKVALYIKSGGLLIVRTIATLGTLTLATSLAARQGPIPMAGHQICIQVWLAVSLLTDALALSGQALLATDYSQENYQQARRVIYSVLLIGLGTGFSLAVFLFLGFGAFSGLFSTDSEVLQIALSGTLFVASSQPVNAIAFVLDGLYYGVSDYEYAAVSMVLVGLISSAFLLVAAPVFSLAGVWTGLFLFMALRVVAGIWRLGTKTGPWKMIYSDMESRNG